MTDSIPELRIGDRQRQVVDERLQGAVGDGVLTLPEYEERAALLWQARTGSDLEHLVVDLPTENRPLSARRGDEQPPVRQVHHGKARDLPARSGGGQSPALLGRSRWREKLAGALVPIALLGSAGAVIVSGTDGRTVFGSTTVRVPSGQTDVAVSVIFGSVEVVVPNDVRVDTGGLVVFGSTDCADACRARDSGAIVVHVRAVGGFGSVEIKTQSEADADGN